MNLLNEVVGTILQVVLFALIPFLVYVISKRRMIGFENYIGVKRSTRKANFLAVLVSLFFSGALLSLAFFSDGFREIIFDPKSVTGKFRTAGLSISSIVKLLIIAIFKTALAEEILFRGFISKRLIAVMGFKEGNLVQAILFGAIHTVIFATVTGNLVFLGIIFVVPTIGAFVSVYLNEVRANGSIIPGWISHGLGNILSYSILGFIM